MDEENDAKRQVQAEKPRKKSHLALVIVIVGVCLVGGTVVYAIVDKTQKPEDVVIHTKASYVDKTAHSMHTLKEKTVTDYCMAKAAEIVGVDVSNIRNSNETYYQTNNGGYDKDGNTISSYSWHGTIGGKDVQFKCFVSSPTDDYKDITVHYLAQGDKTLVGDKDFQKKIADEKSNKKSDTNTDDTDDDSSDDDSTEE